MREAGQTYEHAKQFQTRVRKVPTTLMVDPSAELGAGVGAFRCTRLLGLSW